MAMALDESACDEGRQQHACRGQRQSRPQHRTYGFDFGVKSAREKDDAERRHAYVLGRVDVVELYARAVGAEYHAGQQEHEQRGDAESVSRLRQ